MPDICMCKGEECPKKNVCYRATAKPNELRQSYFTESPIVSDDCDYYWPTKKDKRE